MLKRKTVLIITNHLGLLTGADRVFLLRGNRLEAIGAHEELMSKNPYYASLVIGAD
jgi:ATP-binding cassette subfamily C protein